MATKRNSALDPLPGEQVGSFTCVDAAGDEWGPYQTRRERDASARMLAAQDLANSMSDRQAAHSGAFYDFLDGGRHVRFEDLASDARVLFMAEAEFEHQLLFPANDLFIGLEAAGYVIDSSTLQYGDGGATLVIEATLPGTPARPERTLRLRGADHEEHPEGWFKAEAAALLARTLPPKLELVSSQAAPSSARRRAPC